MKLDYATLISPYPFSLTAVGAIKAPTLREIWNPSVTWQTYNLYLQLLLMTPQTYCGQKDISMFDLIASEQNLQNSYEKMFNFFFEETVIWNKENSAFLTFRKSNGNEEQSLAGIIHRDNFSELCDVILQRCGISRSDTETDVTNVKNKRAKEILEKLQRGRQRISKKSTHDIDVDLPNLVTALAVKSNSINFINIWDLTIYQFYEQFKKEQANVYFDIQKMSVAAYGNAKNTFKGNEWYKQNL